MSSTANLAIISLNGIFMSYFTFPLLPRACNMQNGWWFLLMEKNDNSIDDELNFPGIFSAFVLLQTKLNCCRYNLLLC